MTPAQLHTVTLDRLLGLTSITMYDATVPDNPPADGDGRIYPYAVLWPAPGNTPDAARNLEHDPDGGLMWDARVTVASGNPNWTLNAVSLVRARLEGWRPTPGSMLAELDAGGTVLNEDKGTSPVRWFTPLTFRTFV